MKWNIVNKIDDLLKKHPDVNAIDVKISLKEFNAMYAWIYDDSKRFNQWLNVFKNFIENN